MGKQLNGNLPATVGTDDYFWAELVRMGDSGSAGKIRWNTDLFPDNAEPVVENDNSLPEERQEPTERPDEEDIPSGSKDKEKTKLKQRKFDKTEDSTSTSGKAAPSAR